MRLTETSGRTIKQIADDLGIGLSTLTRWKRQYYEADLLSGPDADVELHSYGLQIEVDFQGR